MIEVRRLTPRMASVLPAKSKNSTPILSEAIYLDTETSHNFNEDTGDGVGWVYQWCFRFCGEFALGRMPTELLQALDAVAEVNQLGLDLRCVIYIHNASYDLSYLLPFLVAHYGKPEHMIARAAHKILTVDIGPFVIRCSYLLANRSLAKWGKDLNIKHKKRTGLIDYNKRRYPDSKLTRDDWVYMMYDVLALEECVRAQLAIYGDDLNSVPLTSTGYVRRDARNEARLQHDRKDFRRTRCSVPVYAGLRFAFSGGLVHGNRFVAGETVVCDVGKNDFRSHYPTQLQLPVYPAGPWVCFYNYEVAVPCSWDKVWRKANTDCCLITAIVRGLELKRGETLPYAQLSKFLAGAGGDFVAEIVDNGRIIKARGLACVTLTELDWEILFDSYDFSEDPQIVRVYTSQRGFAPKYLRDTVNRYYKGKSDFKDLVKELELAEAPDAEIIDADISLTKSKNSLNACYGMCATDPIRREFELNTDTWEWKPEALTEDKIETKLNEYYKSRNSFMRYQIGVYCTAAARMELYRLYRLIGPDAFLYCDTDSIYYRNSPEIEQRLAKWNADAYNDAIQNGYYITNDNGKIVTYHAFEDDRKGKTITSFRFLHAKAYGYTTNDGKLHCTIAGVAARDGRGYTRERELRSLDRLTDGTVFTRCGSTRCVYLVGDVRQEVVDGHIVETSGAAILLPTTKTLHDELHKDQDVYYEEALTRKEVKG